MLKSAYYLFREHFPEVHHTGSSFIATKRQHLSSVMFRFHATEILEILYPVNIVHIAGVGAP